MAKWVFPSTGDGQTGGIGESGIETFRGTPVSSLAREICQNSIDANIGNGEPTRITFSTFELSTSAIPGIDDLKDVFQRCLSLYRTMDNDKTVKFFKNALKACNKPTVTCLRISDFNTTGLTGSRVFFNSPWTNLTKSVGNSDKNGGSGGSFGIGKFATYACSLFRTVFYSTNDINGEQASQGVARLTSFWLNEEECNMAQSVGFFGEDRCSPMYEQAVLDPNFIRDENETGTDIYVIAFEHDEDWQSDLITSVLDGFLWAVYHNQLIVTVNDIEISQNTLKELVSQYQGQFKENADNYYAVLTASDDEAKTFTHDIHSMGEVQLRMLIRPQMHHRCAMVRKTGMKIMDRDRINPVIPFAGVLFVAGDKLNSYLRNLENPQHTKWEVDRAEKGKKSEAKRVLTDLLAFIKKSLDAMQDKSEHASIDPQLGEFLAYIDNNADSGPEDTSEGLSDTIRDFTAPKILTPPKTNNSNLGIGEEDSVEIEADDGDLPGELESGGTGAFVPSPEPTPPTPQSDPHPIPSPEPGPGPNPGPTPNPGRPQNERKKKVVSVSPASLRFSVVDKSSGMYTIIFTPTISAKGYMNIFMSAESQQYDAEILAVRCPGQELSFNGNRISGITYEAKKPLRISIRLNYNDICSLEVRAYGN